MWQANRSRISGWRLVAGCAIGFVAAFIVAFIFFVMIIVYFLTEYEGS